MGETRSICLRVYLTLLLSAQNFGGIYDGTTNGCYLIGGLEGSLPDTKQLEQLLDNKVSSEYQLDVKCS